MRKVRVVTHPEPRPMSPHSRKPELGVVVVNYRSSALIDQNVGGIDWSALPPSLVVVVDSFSSAAERQSVTRLAERQSWELVSTEANVGFGAGVNRGARRAMEEGCTRLLLLNPDVSIDADTISRLLVFGDQHPKTLVSPRLMWPDGSTWFVHGRLDRRTGLTRSRVEARGDDRDDWLTGACLLIDRGTWELLGGFDERYFLYWEDVDLSQRLLDLGGDLRVLDDVAATHSVSGTQNADNPDRKSSRFCFYMCRNRLRFAAAHLPRRDRLRWLHHAPAYTRRAVLGGWRSAFRRPSHAVAALAGTLAGAGAVVLPTRARSAK